jgi:hypothetical protein
MTERLDMAASRNATWAPTIEYIYDGDAMPLTSATMALQWRLYPGATDPALIDLTAVDYEDSSEPTDDAPTRRVLRIFPEIAHDDADFVALPTGLNEPEAGEADVFHWDVVITYADTTLERLIAGEILLEPGVTA